MLNRDADADEAHPSPKDTRSDRPLCDASVSPLAIPFGSGDVESPPRRPSIDNLTTKLSSQNLRSSIIAPPVPRRLSPSASSGDYASAIPSLTPLAPLPVRPSPGPFVAPQFGAWVEAGLAVESNIDTAAAAAPDTEQQPQRQQTSEPTSEPTGPGDPRLMIQPPIERLEPHKRSSVTQNDMLIIESHKTPSPKPGVGFFPLDLEVDESYTGDSSLDPDDLAFMETLAAVRRAGAAPGSRRYGLLRYRPSVAAGLSHSNVVWCPPRVRKRRKNPGQSSAASARRAASSRPDPPRA